MTVKSNIDIIVFTIQQPMKKMHLEILAAVASVAILIVSISASKLILLASPGYGYAAALLIFVIVMSLAGLKLVEIPD